MNRPPHNEELKVCLQTPKFGTLAFFLLMLVLVPISLIYTGNVEFLKYYLPFTVLLASTLTSAGAPNNFTDLYPLFPSTVIGFLSANIINFVALVGILWITIGTAFDYNSRELGVFTGLIIIVLTYPIATQAIPFFIRQGDKFIKRVAPNLKLPGQWHKYFLGLLMSVVIIMLEVLLISLLTSNMEQIPGLKVNNKGNSNVSVNVNGNGNMTNKLNGQNNK
jgi:hypothetical protein